MTNKILAALRTALCSGAIEQREQRIAELEQQLEAEREEDQYPPMETVREDRQFVEDALQDLDGWSARESYWWDDRLYNLPSRDGFGRAVLHDKVNEREYVDEVFDCDNYSDHIVAMFADEYTCNAVGTVISAEAGTPHAFNITVFPDGEAELYEPNGNERFVTDEDDPEDKYTLEGAMIRI